MLKPANLTSDQVAIALKPTFGGEMKVYLTRDRHFEVGTIEIAALNSGIATTSASEMSALSASPSELVAIIDNADVYAGSANLVITVIGKDADGAALTGTITFKAPTHSAIQDRQFPVGWAVEVEPSVADKKFKSIHSWVVTGAQADAKGGKITLFAVPSLTRFNLVGCTTDQGFTTKSQQPVSVQCGMDESAYTKPGTTKPSELRIKAKWIAKSEGLGRFDGIKCTARVDVVKEGKVICERLFFLGYIPKVDAGAGEGLDVGAFDAVGNYEDLAWLVADS